MPQFVAYMYDEDAPEGYELQVLSDPYYARTTLDAVQAAKEIWPHLPIAVEELGNRANTPGLRKEPQ
jgi:hypothetical protein